MNRSVKPIVGISCGDPNGIGLEVLLKSLNNPSIKELIIPVVFCDFEIIEFQNNYFNIKLKLNRLKKNQSPKSNHVNVIDIKEKGFNVEFGNVTKHAGLIAFNSLKHTSAALKNGNVDFMVTAPINKNNIQSKEFDFPGHTDYLTNFFDGEGLMFMISEDLKVGLLTDHVPLNKITNNLSAQIISSKIKTMHFSLKTDFSISSPKIAVLSINPHVGDDGVIGIDDQDILVPSIKKLIDQGYGIYGPFAADSFFGSGKYKKYDAIMAVYHDQGLIPFKTITFGNGVNFTAGLDKIRTSPDHGTAFDIAGKNIADHSSFMNSIKSGLRIFNNRA